MNYAIETVGVHKSFGGVKPARDVSFGVAPGELRCLIGPNGAGKSTLFNLIVGIERVDQGSVHIFDADVTREPTFRRIRRGIGVKLQSNRSYKNLDVSHNIRVSDGFTRWGNRGRGMRGAGISRDKALELFGLESVVSANPPVRSLSHAQQQWLEICCAISTGIGILLLDEPTAGMGVEETKQTGQVLKELQAMGLTIVVVEHDMLFVRDVADHVTVLHEGQVFAEGGMEELASRDDVREIYLG